MTEKPDNTPEKPAEGAEETSAPDLKKIQAELDKAKNDYLYLLAEFDNYRKNAIKERSELVKYGSEKFIREMLGIIDDFERALEAPADADPGSFRQGVEMIAKSLRQLLQKFGVEEVKAEGVPFDPNVHDALGSEPRADVPAGQIIRVLKKAYKMHDKLLRPAQVIVAIEAKE